MATKPAMNENLTAAVTEVVEGQITGKKWYYSKTFWANILAGVAVIAQVSYGFVFPVEYQMLGLSLINMGLRKISSGEIIW
jgi:inner membrane protein involved in colicin E2 resistance